MRKFFVVAVLGLLVSVLGASPASAHAALVGTDPEDGASLQALPDSITFTFNENVGNVNVAVQAPDGSPLELSDVAGVDNMATATLADPGQRGEYTASYRVVSADGHPISGTVKFMVLTGEAVDQVDIEPVAQGFFDRHTDHIIWGSLAGLAAIALIVWPLRRRDDAHSA
ncbi:copper resistance CopC family protein [Aeromicrobium sp. CF3.5]|uniref:copper resistance CopC family protein n=1 Tax=Aeromicrobium sp. CF3.5 TaxID=3373078 RepID=UPI003EE657AF